MNVIHNVSFVVENLVRLDRDEKALSVQEIRLVCLRNLVADTGAAIDVVRFEEAR